MTQYEGCPLCGRPGQHEPDPHHDALARCTDCDLVYAASRYDTRDDYAGAYQGTEDAGAIMSHLATTLPWPEQSPDLRDSWAFLTLAQIEAIRRLRREHPAPAPVLDLGCGSGWFVGALRLAGYQPYGVDVAPAAVDLVQRKGIPAAVGVLEDVPAEWPEPVAVSMFEVIEHLPDPVTTVSEIRQRYPSAMFLASVPSEERWTMLAGRGEWDYPPNHLTRWTPPALQRLLAQSGYSRVEVVRLPPTAYEIARISVRWMIHARLGRWEPERWAGAQGTGRLRSLERELKARRRKELLARPLELPLRALRRTALSWLVVARP